ncbi:hypothetical protein [Falsiroseomonas tokyonensis]|uniref:hypothetical protein n=1 Tax=Falsiroseomonas tokyonensis TaxID=430521 RepID=UPI001C203789|nr:hypothetical protein [Falsiroseomonas tokyonensis]
MFKRPRPFHPPRPPKPPDRLQNMQTLKPFGKNHWVKAHWRYDYQRRQWEWVLGHWTK